MKFALLLFCYALINFSFAQTKQTKQTKVKSVVLFAVDKTVVTVDEFIYLYKKNHQDKEKDFTSEKINEYLGLFIKFKLKVEEAKRRGLDTTKAFLKEYTGYKEELRKPYLPDAKIVDSLVRLTYNRMKEEINASHILISLKPDSSPTDTLQAFNKIIAIRKRVLEGGDFGEAAVLSSDDPSAKSNQGNLGYFTAMQMVYPFETAAYSTKVGDISQPIRTRFGYHIIKVLDRRAARGEVELSHIMMRTGSNTDSEKVKNTIFTLHDQLQAGMNWNELCKQYSEDTSTKDKGGKLKPFGTGAMSAVPEFERIAFDLQKQGEISDPFQTQYGWHIIRLDRKIPLPTHDEIAPTLKLKVARDERTDLSKQALQSKLRREFQFKENQMVKSKIVMLADSSLTKGQWKARVSTKEAKELLFTLKEKQYLAGDFFSYIKEHQRSTPLSPEKYLDQLYNQYVDANIMKEMEDKIKRENPDYGFLLQEYYEGILLFDIMEKEVWSKASEDSIGQQLYYNSHLSDYHTGERAKVAFYSSTSNDFSEPLHQIILSGNESKIQQFVNTNKIKTEWGYFKKEDRIVLQKVPWTKGVYPAENNGMYYLAWIKDILSPGPMSFDEARSAIISDYQTFLEKSWLEQLKKKYSVKVNDKGRQYILQQLQGR